VADPKSHWLPDDTQRVAGRLCLNSGRVVAKSADGQQPDDMLSKRLHWQIPDTEILYRGAIPVLRFRDPPTLLLGPL
jgi:hypothetical protein